MVEFISKYDNYAGLKYDPKIAGHGAIYGSSSSLCVESLWW